MGQQQSVVTGSPLIQASSGTTPDMTQHMIGILCCIGSLHDAMQRSRAIESAARPLPDTACSPCKPVTARGSTPVRAVELPWQAAALEVAKGAKEGGNVLAGGLKGHVAHHQLGAQGLASGGFGGLALPGCSRALAALVHAELEHQLVPVQQGALQGSSRAC